MKRQQITLDLSNMVYTAFSYLALAGAVWIFLRLLQACFWLPRHLKKQNDVQQMLQEKVDSYEKYILECEEKEKTMILDGESTEEQNVDITKKWLERRECLEMLKQELKKIENGDEINYEDYLSELDEEVKEEMNEKEMKKDKEDGKGKKCEKEEEAMMTEIGEVKISEKGKKRNDKKSSGIHDDASLKMSEDMNLLIGKKENEEKEEKMIKKDK
ncbi:high mobility group nucleosome-binding domain-containing protein 5-like isoform X1 [Vespa mandarinia]|uniref:high mobility group nucleosome-binding domain-containing protein 5-like isoform X1 n=1 Tax=Vespa mandarinia TaxID=7446 RepID=UPI00160DA87E|nr:high mobility group nucleosome-binding domain-containing protein 5-like isoform X1 [Vespa mandarinia]XP_035721896.1 high mobility group nucleosome-binding domain-containing protein 5-like isoform X1 [Vespa mandarinia]